MFVSQSETVFNEWMLHCVWLQAQVSYIYDEVTQLLAAHKASCMHIIAIYSL